jgi:hypothetical protein
LYARKDDVPRWAGATFRRGYRTLAQVLRVSWLVLDLDAGAERAQIVRTFGALRGVAHTTWSAGRWRVGLVLSRHVGPADHERVWRAGAALSEHHGLIPDYAARSAAHCFALPALGGAPYEHVDLTGEPFDVSGALAEFPVPEPLPEPTRPEHSDAYDRRHERARRYLERMPGAVSGSGGHATTFRAAVALVRGFELEPDDALRLLVDVHNPLCAPPWSLPELRHKVRQASERGRVPFGTLADRPFERGLR